MKNLAGLIIDVMREVKCTPGTGVVEGVERWELEEGWKWLQGLQVCLKECPVGG